MSQQGGWGPQQGGYPQQGGFPPQGGQGYQPQGQGYQPQGAYGQQSQGYQPQGGYGQQPGYGQQGYQQGGFQTGGPRPSAPTPPAKGGSTKIIGIVVGALVVLGLIAALVSFLSPKKAPTDPGGGVTVSTPSAPTTTTPATTAPATTAPATTAPATTKPATPGPSTSTGGGTTGGSAVVVGQGISVTPADGWKVVKQEEDFVVLQKGNAVFLAEVGKVEPSTTGTQLVDRYLESQAKQMTNVKKGTTSTVNVDPSLSVAKGIMAGTVSGSGGSQNLGFGSLASVRTADGVALVGTLAWPVSEDVAQYNTDYTKMLTSMLATQLKK